MKTLFLVPVALSMALVAGCSSRLEVSPYEKEPQTGIVHALPMTQFKVKITRRIAECFNGNEPRMKVATTFQVEETSVEDPAATFVIQPKSLSTWMNTAGVEVSFHENTRILKSVNASGDDHTADAIVSAVKIAGAAVGVSAFGAPVKAGAQSAHVCNDAGNDIPDKVMKANAGLEKLKDLTSALTTSTAELTDLIAGYLVRFPGGDPLNDDTVRQRYRYVTAAKANVAAQQTVVDQLLKPISHSTSVTWPDNGITLGRDGPYRVPEAVLDNWVNTSYSEAQRRVLDIYFRIEAADIADAWQLEANRQNTDVIGIAYRTPQPGKLIFEREKVPDNGAPASQGDRKFEKIGEHSAIIPQLGFINKLVIEARAFESIEYTAEFDKSGRLVKSGYKQKNAPVQALSSISETIGEQLLALETARQGQAQAKLDAELKRLQAEVGIAEANQALNPVEPTVSQAEINMLTADTAMLQAEIALLEAQARLRELSM